VNVRFIAASNADFNQLISAGRFRQDLLERFGYFVIHLPPLAERQDEILPLVEHFLRNARSGNRRTTIPQLAPELAEVLLTAPWPGNIRELRSLTDYLALTSGQRPWIEVRDLPPQFLESLPRDRWRGDFSDCRVHRALDEADGNREAAARALGMSSRHIRRIVSKSKKQSDTGDSAS
jgi:DNA-binding NtrC family response regulator